MKTIQDALQDNSVVDWANAFRADLDDDHVAGLLECEADSVCGKIIIDMCKETERFIKRLNQINTEEESYPGSIEDSTHDAIITAIVQQACVVLFG